jgi:hypothetical protein
LLKRNIFNTSKALIIMNLIKLIITNFMSLQKLYLFTCNVIIVESKTKFTFTIKGLRKLVCFVKSVRFTQIKFLFHLFIQIYLQFVVYFSLK